MSEIDAEREEQERTAYLVAAAERRSQKMMLSSLVSCLPWILLLHLYCASVGGRFQAAEAVRQHVGTAHTNEISTLAGGKLWLTDSPVQQEMSRRETLSCLMSGKFVTVI